MGSLFVIQGRDQGRRFDIEDQVVTLGRDADNVIQLHDSEVSRHHAELRPGPDGVLLADLGSSNGTLVNGQAVETHPLRSGDRVQFGRTLLIFTAADDSSQVIAEDVDIVAQGDEPGESRIVKSIGQEREPFPLVGEDRDSPWLARARGNLQIMYRTALAVSHTLDIDQLLHRILELIFEWVEADRGCIMLVDAETSELTPRATRNRRRRTPEDRSRLEISRTILDYVMQHHEGVLTSDAREDDRWDPAASIVKMGIREAICVPMQGRYGIVGVIYIDTYTAPGRFVQRAQNKFSEDHLKLMVAIAHQAALAVEDTAYYSAMLQAERLAAMGQTIATLSHHVKNILQGIRGGSYLIQEGLKINDAGVIGRGWAIVERNQEKISQLVMDMLTFSKERQPELVEANLNDLAREIVELMETRAREANVALRLLPAEGLPDLLYDPELMHRALLNVVTNAIDACENRSPAAVTVAVQLAGKWAQFTVADTGEGIGDDDIKRIFSVFESKKGSRGTGLGLPVSQKILREHGGEIVVESSPGQGSRFILRFPALFPEVSQKPATLTEMTF